MSNPVVAVRLKRETLEELDLIAVAVGMKRSAALVEAVKQWVAKERASADTQEALKYMAEQATCISGGTP